MYDPTVLLEYYCILLLFHLVLLTGLGLRGILCFKLDITCCLSITNVGLTITLQLPKLDRKLGNEAIYWYVLSVNVDLILAYNDAYYESIQ